MKAWFTAAFMISGHMFDYLLPLLTYDILLYVWYYEQNKLMHFKKSTSVKLNKILIIMKKKKINKKTKVTILWVACVRWSVARLGLHALPFWCSSPELCECTVLLSYIFSYNYLVILWCFDFLRILLLKTIYLLITASVSFFFLS